MKWNIIDKMLGLFQTLVRFLITFLPRNRWSALTRTTTTRWRSASPGILAAVELFCAILGKRPAAPGQVVGWKQIAPAA